MLFSPASPARNCPSLSPNKTSLYFLFLSLCLLSFSLHCGMEGTAELDSLRAVSVLGRGGKGVVFLVRDSTSGQAMALKVISKASRERKAQHGEEAYRRIWLEREVLSSLRHPLLPQLHGFISTEKIFGFVMDRCPGGNLASLRNRQSEKMFSDDTIRFYAAELVLALEHLHSQGIVYRDLKPENILIQANGHIMVVDFDLSTKLSLSSPPSERRMRRSTSPKWWVPCKSVLPQEEDEEEEKSTEKSNSFVGTEEYVAPEVISGSGHDFAVDWWSLGVVLYEMLYGKTPFRGQHRKQTFHLILTKSPPLIGEQTLLRDLIRRLLDKDPRQRIAIEEIKAHGFFSGVDWRWVLEISRPPFIPFDEDHEKDEDEIIDVEELLEKDGHWVDHPTSQKFPRPKRDEFQVF